MLRNTLTDKPLSLFCLVDGEQAPFAVDIESTETISKLKEAIKLENAPEFDDIAADRLTLWRVSVPAVPDKNVCVSLNSVAEKEELATASAKLFKVFDYELPEEAIHIIVCSDLKVMQLCLSLTVARTVVIM